MMNLVFLIFKTVLSMSVSGSFLIMILLVGKRFLKNKCSRQWQYYIWLIVVLRLVLPFDPKINLMGNVYQIFDRMVTQALLPAGQENSRQDTDDFAVYSENMTQGIQKAAQPEGGISVFPNGIGWFWLLIALGMLIRKITAYQSFVRYVAAGTEAVSNVALLEELSTAATQIRVNRRVELGLNPLLSSPTLTGIFHPCIILPDADISPKDFRYIALHELTHCKRQDIFYKWLVQTVVCLHWFNPFVHLMSQEINNACEFSCDEAVLKKTGYKDAQDYGRTLLDAMAAVGRYKESSAAITLSANKQLLKERLGAIMSCGEKSRAVRVLTAVLTIGMILGAVFVGLYPAQAEEFQELFGDMGEELTEEYPRIMYVNANVLVCNVRAGAGEEYAVVGMLSQEEEVTVLEMVEGSGERNWYRIDKESLPEDMGISTEECYIRSDLLQEK